jgi:carbon-monoxide dehydrogenase small subunit
MEIQLRVNGKEQRADIEPRTLLCFFLRDNLGLTGTHVGCETSLCGACTVLVDGKAVKSCTRFAVQCDGHDILSIEGLANGETLHPLQEAFRDKHGLQCGFCTSGMIMTGVDLIERGGAQSESDVRHGLAGNLCRCTGYQNIVDAMRDAETQMRGVTR